MRIKYRLYLYEPHSRDRLRRLIISCSLQKVRTDLLRRRRRKDHSGLPHGGSVIRSGVTGIDKEHTHVIEYSRNQA